MHISATVAGVRRRIATLRNNASRIAFVPTMGNLHQGHLSLIDTARRENVDAIVVSIFVNPLQFGPQEDFASYPRTFVNDRSALDDVGVDLLFMPDVGEIYPGDRGKSTRIEVPELSDILCGEFRPGHFSGVATVITRLFNIVQPDVAVFGEKDFQQLAVIRRLIRDLRLAVEIISSPTIREVDGLAMSSRNRYLTESERHRAPELYRTLTDAGHQLQKNDTTITEIETSSMHRLRSAGFKPDYFSVRDAGTLGEPTPDCTEFRILVAAWLSNARLIDNIGVSRPA